MTRDQLERRLDRERRVLGQLRLARRNLRGGKGWAHGTLHRYVGPHYVPPETVVSHCMVGAMLWRGGRDDVLWGSVQTLAGREILRSAGVRAWADPSPHEGTVIDAVMDWNDDHTSPREIMRALNHAHRRVRDRVRRLERRLRELEDAGQPTVRAEDALTLEEQAEVAEMLAEDAAARHWTAQKITTTKETVGV